MNNKRGLSNVIVNSIIIFISLSFISMGLIFVSQKNIIGERVKDVSLDDLTLDVEILNAKIEGNNIAIDVKRNMGKGDLTGIKFIFSDGKITEVKEALVSLKELELKTFDFTLSKLDVSKVKSISIAPIFKIKFGKEEIGKIIDTYSVEQGKNIIKDETFSFVCGNGILESGEQCDDGNINDGDGCSSICQTKEEFKAESICVFTNAYWSNNHLIENKIATLVIEGVGCNGQLVNFKILEYNVLLKDDPVNIKPKSKNFILNTATTTWVTEYQDDGIIDPEYYFIATLSSNSSIKIETIKSENDFLQVSSFVEQGENIIKDEILGFVCGNGILESGEQCDDGNTISGDGCSSTCGIETTISGDKYPRLGVMAIGRKDYENPEFQAQLAKFDIVVIGTWPGWEKGHGGAGALDASVSAIKQINPNALVFQYINVNERRCDTEDTASREYIKKLNTEKWWLYTKGTSGTPVASTWKPTIFCTTNPTDSVKPDVNGDRYHDWFAKQVNTDYFSKAPELDGWFLDNVFRRPRVNGDWNLDGNIDDKKNTQTHTLFRQGMKETFDALKKEMPNMITTGNLGDWRADSIPISKVMPEYDGQLDGGFLERILGETWSLEGLDRDGVLHPWGSWKLMMDTYRSVIDRVKEPKLLGFHMKGYSTDYKSFRYGFTSSLMDNGYFSYSEGKYIISVWFDEYDLAGTSNTKWLGKAISSPQLSPWQNGVYRRDFENGIALINPRGNGQQTVTLEPGFKRFLGKQDPNHNNGRSVSSITLDDRDGIVLVRE